MPPALFVGNARALCPVLVGRSAPLQQQFLVPPPMGCVYAKQSSNSSLDCAVNSHPGKGEFGEIRNGKPKFNDGSFGSSSSSAAAAAREAERKRERYSFRMQANPPRYIEAEQVAAGWPAWLTAVAGEAIQGWIPRRADSFEKLDKIGQGTYSNVYKARDLDTGKIVALKKVRFDNLEPESVRFMAREIQVLRRLDHPNIVKLEGLVSSRMSCSLYLVFEYMDHDLAGLAASPGIKFTEAQVKCYMQQLLSGLDHCHIRGVLHRDIKGSNLLIDNGGILKIADFGLATFFYPGQRQPLTSRVVTLWYRPPELLLGATDYGEAVDLWSTGCILAELLAGKPIMPGRTEVEQLHKIFKLCGSPSEEYWKKSKLPHATIFKPQQPYKRCIAETFKDFPLTALALVETLLAIEASCRGTAAAALKSEFFTTKPLACDPSSLPKYPPSKEFDIKIRDEEARRRKAAAGRGRGSEVARRALRESRAVPAPDGNAELAASMQRRHLNFQGPSKSKSEKFNSQHDDGAIGFPIDPPRPLNASVEKSDDAESPGPHPEPSYSGPLSTFTMNGFAQERNQNDHDVQMASVWHSARPSKSVMKPGFKMQGTYGPQPGLDSHKTVNSLQQHSHVDATNGVHEDKYKLSDLPEHSTKEEWRADSIHGVDAFHFQDFSRSHFQRVDRLATKEPVMGSANEGDRVEYSGPLLSQSANIDEILEKHERQIQQAVRRARQEKWKAHKNNSARGGKKAVEQKSWISTANGSKDVGHN